ncbi:hypothetical protein P9112_012400 [Eukaryota sp. TZLM1-RC]
MSPPTPSKLLDNHVGRICDDRTPVSQKVLIAKDLVIKVSTLSKPISPDDANIAINSLVKLFDDPDPQLTAIALYSMRPFAPHLSDFSSLTSMILPFLTSKSPDLCHLALKILVHTTPKEPQLLTIVLEDLLSNSKSGCHLITTLYCIKFLPKMFTDSNGELIVNKLLYFINYPAYSNVCLYSIEKLLLLRPTLSLTFFNCLVFNTSPNHFLYSLPILFRVFRLCLFYLQRCFDVKTIELSLISNSVNYFSFSEFVLFLIRHEISVFSISFLESFTSFIIKELKISFEPDTNTVSSTIQFSSEVSLILLFKFKCLILVLCYIFKFNPPISSSLATVINHLCDWCLSQSWQVLSLGVDCSPVLCRNRRHLTSAVVRLACYLAHFTTSTAIIDQLVIKIQMLSNICPSCSFVFLYSFKNFNILSKTSENKEFLATCLLQRLSTDNFNDKRLKECRLVCDLIVETQFLISNPSFIDTLPLFPRGLLLFALIKHLYFIPVSFYPAITDSCSKYSRNLLDSTLTKCDESFTAVFEIVGIMVTVFNSSLTISERIGAVDACISKLMDVNGDVASKFGLIRSFLYALKKLLLIQRDYLMLLVPNPNLTESLSQTISELRTVSRLCHSTTLSSLRCFSKLENFGYDLRSATSVYVDPASFYQILVPFTTRIIPFPRVLLSFKECLSVSVEFHRALSRVLVSISGLHPNRRPFLKILVEFELSSLSRFLSPFLNADHNGKTSVSVTVPLEVGEVSKRHGFVRFKGKAKLVDVERNVWGKVCEFEF